LAKFSGFEVMFRNNRFQKKVLDVKTPIGTLLPMLVVEGWPACRSLQLWSFCLQPKINNK
jgi:hypothetical protein